MVKAAIDLGSIKVFSHQRQRIELRAGALRIDPPSPVSIRPTGWSNMYVIERAHARIVSDNLQFVEHCEGQTVSEFTFQSFDFSWLLREILGCRFRFTQRRKGETKGAKKASMKIMDENLRDSRL
jgi:hypothetical protein